MYITILKLNIKDRKSVEYIYDNSKMHKLLCGLSKSNRCDSNILYKMRDDGSSIFFYVQADEVLPYSQGEVPYLLVDGKEEKSFLYVNDFCVEPILEKKELRFHLSCSPSKKGTIDGKHKRVLITDSNERLEWVNRKLSETGAIVKTIKETSGYSKRFTHNKEKGSKGYIPGYNYIGILEVVDKGKLYDGIKHGYGSGKCYGSGMLMIQ